MSSRPRQIEIELVGIYRIISYFIEIYVLQRVGKRGFHVHASFGCHGYYTFCGNSTILLKRNSQ